MIMKEYRLAEKPFSALRACCLGNRQEQSEDIHFLLETSPRDGAATICCLIPTPSVLSLKPSLLTHQGQRERVPGKPKPNQAPVMCGVTP